MFSSALATAEKEGSGLGQFRGEVTVRRKMKLPLCIAFQIIIRDLQFQSNVEFEPIFLDATCELQKL